MDALRLFASDGTRCRRRMILEFFGETPAWQRCGTCDNCVMHEKHGGDPRFEGTTPKVTC